MEKTAKAKKQEGSQSRELDFTEGGMEQTLNLTGVENEQLEEMINEILGPLADDYSLKILAATREEGKTVRQLSRDLDIPIATCYRRVEDLVENNLLQIKEKKLTQEGKRATVVRTNVSFVEITFGFDNKSLNVSIESTDGAQKK